MAQDGTPRFGASNLGLFCLPMSHKKDDRLLLVNVTDHLKYWNKPNLEKYIDGNPKGASVSETFA